MNTELADQIRSFMSERLSIPIENIKNNSALGKDLEMDSLDLVDVVIGLQDLYNIHIKENELQFMIYFFNIYESVEYHLKNKA